MTTYNISYNGEDFVNEDGTWYEVDGETWYEVEDLDFCCELDSVLTDDTRGGASASRLRCEDAPCCGCCD